MKRAVDLVNGHQMPIVGFGTFKIRGYDVVFKCLDAALAAGYRSFDTASVYRNEEDIGASLKELLPKYNLNRKDIFITSKLGPSEQGAGKAFSACLSSIQRLDCSYLDLYLIHWPGVHKLQPADEMHRVLRAESWKDMEEAYNQGQVKSLGISNYLPRHIEDLLSYCKIKPAVLQTEYHPHLIQKEVKELCDKHRILLQAYSSLGTTTVDNKLMSDETVKEIASSLNKSAAQVLLRWAIQQNIGVLPKSTNPKHIAENINVFSFSLSGDQMEQLSHLDTQTHYCWDPACIK